MSLVRAKSLAVRAVPCANDVVLANGEDEIAFLGESAGSNVSSVFVLSWARCGVLDLGERTLVAGK